jgi:ubiquinone/menaquinone biosynthesis C-methylase UbiE
LKILKYTKNHKITRLALKIAFYQNDRERWSEIGKMRNSVAKTLQIPQGSVVLDVLVGEGDFSRTLAVSSKGTRIVAGEILSSDLKEAKRRIEKDRLKKRIELLKIDVTSMAFCNNSFDYVVNFAGWEDFAAISGEELIDKAFSEMTRVLKANGFLAVTFTPALKSEDEISRKDKELQDFMYKSSMRPRFYEEKFFREQLNKYGIKLLRRKAFHTSKNRLQPSDSKEYIKWICNNYKSFYAPDVEMRTHEEILREFQQFIEKYGIREMKSSFILLVGKKSSTLSS